MRSIESANLRELLGKACSVKSCTYSYCDEKIHSVDKEDRQICRLYRK